MCFGVLEISLNFDTVLKKSYKTSNGDLIPKTKITKVLLVITIVS